MSKKNRRTDKGQPGAAGGKRALRRAREMEARFEQQWRDGAVARVQEVMAEIATEPVAAVRRPYEPATDWLATTARRLGITAAVHPSPLPKEPTIPFVVDVQPDSFYDGVAYGMTGCGEMVMMGLHDTVDSYEAYNDGSLTIEVIEPLPSEWVLEAADMLIEEHLNLAYVAAYVQTGYLITRDTEALYTAAEKDTWRRLVADAFAAYPTLAPHDTDDAGADESEADADAVARYWLPDLESAEAFLLPLYTVLHPLVAREFDTRMDQRHQAEQVAFTAATYSR